MFQIASIVLWSLDDYYYYAFCIALISAISIITTLVETKQVCVFICILHDNVADICPQTIARMREMSRFICKASVYRDGSCKPSSRSAQPELTT